MSRKSVIQLVQVPAACGDASDLRYRLLMAALGSGDEDNPLLTTRDIADGAEEPAEAETQAEIAPEQPAPNASAVDPRSTERPVVAGQEAPARSLSVVRGQAPSPPAVRKTATAESVPASGAPVPRPPKPR